MAVGEAVTAPFVPSGSQVALAAYDQELVVAEVGGGIRSYRREGRDVLDGYEAAEICSGGRGQLLAPWPNRVGDGRWEWDGFTHQLALTEPEHSNAIHGLVRWLPWTAEQTDAESSARMACTLHPQPGWPWQLELSVRYELSPTGLSVTTSVTNEGGPGPCPVGIGWHPYISAFGELVDDVELLVPAISSYISDERGLPLSKEPVEGTDDDFRSPRRVGRARLDVAFTDLERDSDGRSIVEVRGAGGQIVRLWMDDHYTHLMIYTGDTLADVSRRRRGIGIEPMTCAPDMLRNRDGMVVLEPGASLEAEWGLEFFKI
jgi:aldose 1-epimerase